MRDLSLVPIIRYIKIAIAAPIVLNIRCSVYAGTKDVPILFTVSGCQSARTGHITVTFFIYKKGIK
jgi:hypothetical protein